MPADPSEPGPPEDALPEAGPPGAAPLLARLDALERRVAELEAERRRVPPPLPFRQRVHFPQGLRVPEVQSEDVLGKVGIALLLVGVLFLLKYTLDRDLLTPAVRVAGAGAIGAALVAVGLRLRERRRTLGRLLTGGGVAALYGSLWAAGLLYPLLPVVAAFAGMAAVAALALALAVRERDAALSVVGTLGGLMTPLLLYRDPGQMPALVAYTALVLGGAAVVYARHGWSALVSAAAGGGWGVVLVAWLVGIQPDAAAAAMTDRLAFTLGVAAVWATTGLLPLRVNSARREAPALPLQQPEALTTLAAPLLGFGFLSAVWAWPAGVAGAVALALALAYAAGARAVRDDPRRFEPLVLAAAALAAWAAARWLGLTDARTLGVGVALACAVLGMARRRHLADLLRVGDVAALGLAAVLLLHLFLVVGVPWGPLEALSAGDRLRETIGAIAAAAALGAIGLTAPFNSTRRAVYLTAGHTVVLLLLRLLLRPLPEGPSLTSAAWGVYAVVAIVAGLRLRDDVLRGIGLGTILATVGKLLIFDLSSIPTLWRVGLFLGLGVLLLLVSYFVPALIRGPGRRPPPVPDLRVPAAGGDGAT